MPITVSFHVVLQSIIPTLASKCLLTPYGVRSGQKKGCYRDAIRAKTKPYHVPNMHCTFAILLLYYCTS